MSLQKKLFIVVIPQVKFLLFFLNIYRQGLFCTVVFAALNTLLLRINIYNCPNYFYRK